VERQARRGTATAGIPAEPAAPRRTDSPGGNISWTGLIGGVLGFGALVALGVSLAAGAGDSSSWWAIPFLLFSLLFLPAIYVSVKPVEAREFVLKLIVIISLVFSITGSILVGAALLVVLTPCLALLAQAAGFIFQGSSRKS